MSVDGRSSTAIECSSVACASLSRRTTQSCAAVLSRSLTRDGTCHRRRSIDDDRRASSERASCRPTCCSSMRSWAPRRLLEAAKTLAHDNPGVAVIFLCGESTFAIDGDVADTTAISVLPSSCPAALLDSSIRLAAQRDARAPLGARRGA